MLGHYLSIAFYNSNSVLAHLSTIITVLAIILAIFFFHLAAEQIEFFFQFLYSFYLN